MSSWGSDPEGSADQLIRRSLDDIGVRGRVLLAYQSGDLAQELGQRGAEATVWNRRLAGGHAAAAWPTGSGYDIAFLRLPKAKEEQEMAAHAVLSVLAEDGRLVVYGGNDEGIRSAATMLEQLMGSVDTLATRGHGRVLAVRRPADVSALRTPLSAWRRWMPLEVGGVSRDWVTYPGVFAGARLDEGTELLLGVLPSLGASARVLDYGCGSGIIGASAVAAMPGTTVELLDNDAVALEAARENVPGARCILGARLPDAGRVFYDAILSNPPLHDGIAETYAPLEKLIADAPQRLKPGGLLQMVVQRRVALDRLLAKEFSKVATVTENGRYRVWRATR